MTPTYHVDGRLVPAGEGSVDIRDRGFMYGDAAFETLRVYDGEPFGWEAHVDRLERTLTTLDFAEAMPPRADLLDRVDETVAANDFTDCWAKLSITRGVQPGKLTPADRVDPTILVTLGELPRGGVHGHPVWDGPATTRIATRRQPSPDAIPPGAKTHNYLHGILARLELRGTESDEALVLDGDGYLTEGATSNLFFVDEGRLRTPSTARPLLPGITRSVVLELARSEDFPVETGSYRRTDLRRADEVFLTNSTWEIRPVTRVGDETYDVGPITTLLGRLFDERVEAEHYD
ncbi:MAG: aminodeoxychorismate lyase [Haloarculaceae archaeon]